MGPGSADRAADLQAMQSPGERVKLLLQLTGELQQHRRRDLCCLTPRLCCLWVENMDPVMSKIHYQILKVKFWDFDP